jgi:hypothetical protein
MFGFAFGIGPFELLFIAMIALGLCAAPVVLIVLLVFVLTRAGRNDNERR